MRFTILVVIIVMLWVLAVCVMLVVLSIGVPGGVFSMIVWAVIVMGYRCCVTALIRVPTLMVLALALSSQQQTHNTDRERHEDPELSVV